MRTRRSRVARSRGLPLGIPDYKFAKLRYVDNTAQLNWLAGAYVTSSEYLLNSAYDPRYDSGPNQIAPQYYLNYANQYNFYRVYGVKIKTTIWNNNDDPVRLHHIISNSEIFSSFGTSIDPRVLAENKWVFTQELAGQTSQVKPVTFKKYIPLYKVAGVSKTAYSIDDMFGSLISTNPANGIYYAVYCKGLNTATSGTLWCTVQLTYYMKFYDKKMVLVTNTVDVPEHDLAPWDVAPDPGNDGPDGPPGFAPLVPTPLPPP